MTANEVDNSKANIMYNMVSMTHDSITKQNQLDETNLAELEILTKSYASFSQIATQELPFKKEENDIV